MKKFRKTKFIEEATVEIRIILYGTLRGLVGAEMLGTARGSGTRAENIIKDSEVLDNS